MSGRTPWRARAMLGATLLGWREAGFLIPSRHAACAAPIHYPAIGERLAAALPATVAILEAAAALVPELLAMRGPAPEPRLDQDWFCGLDAALATALVRWRRPRRIVEIGCGHSTRFMARAIRDGGLETDLVCIDPLPRAPLAGLKLRHVASTVQAAPASAFAGLAAGDVLFIDSSHVLMPGSDVDVLLNVILPSLPAGVLVHVHDVFLPDPYPEVWAWRGYNEQLLVAALIAGGRLEPIIASHWLRAHRPELIEGSPLAALAPPSGAFESSFWGVLR